MTKTIWGDYPGGSLAELPAQRMGYNAATKRGLSNLSKEKVNLVNLTYGKLNRDGSRTMLCTSESDFIKAFTPAYEAMKNYDCIAVMENEPGNRTKIGNADSGLYISNLSWNKRLADKYKVLTMHGGIMHPAANKILYDTLPGTEQKAMRAYMNARGLFIGSYWAAKDAITELQFCQKNGIIGNFHSQNECVYLPRVVDAMKVYCQNMSNNEIGFRTDDAEIVEATVNALGGRLTHAIIYNTTGDGGKAHALNTEQKEVFMKLI